MAKATLIWRFVSTNFAIQPSTISRLITNTYKKKEQGGDGTGTGLAGYDQLP
jgi:hypothetical protein